MNPPAPVHRADTPAAVFRAFLRLGLTSFGGPIAHLGYFRTEFVTRRGWLDEAAYAELVALCQFLPGPASSQTGFAIGLARAGPWGGLAAFAGFTLPSAGIMLALALLSGTIAGPQAAIALHGLKLVAVVIVAQAVWGMARTLTPDVRRLAIAVAAVIVLQLLGGSGGQIAAVLGGAIAGMVCCRHIAVPAGAGLPLAIGRRAGITCLVAAALLLAILPLVAAMSGSPSLRLFDIFYRAGALVFGGGHVVLPLLQTALVPTGLIDNDRFLAGYGAAQALPGPLFALAAYLGGIAGGGAGGALLALVGIFLPGLLVLVGVLPFWARLRGIGTARAAIAGVNAAVVGILAAALYDPLWTGSVATGRDIALVGVGLIVLLRWQVSPLALAAAMVLATFAMAAV